MTLVTYYPKFGDIFFVRAPFVNHVAICLGKEIYEAIPSVGVHAISWDEFSARVSKPRWGREAKVEVYTNTGISTPDSFKMLGEADRLLGTQYSWWLNYLRKGPRVHCSECVARVVKDRGFGGIEPSRVSPRILRQFIVIYGWDRHIELQALLIGSPI